MKVELESVFTWECPNCEFKNVEQPVSGIISDEMLESLDDNADAFLIASDETQGEDHARLFETLTQRILIAPKFVTCDQCGQTHIAEIPE